MHRGPAGFIFSKLFTVLIFTYFAHFVLQFVKNMTSDNFADQIRSLIKDNIKQINYSVGTDKGTSHLSVLTEDGSAVAVTSSINN